MFESTLLRTIKTFLYFTTVAIFFVTSCAQQPRTQRLLAEINAAKVKARDLIIKAEVKRREAGTYRAPGDRGEYDRLIQEAAMLYKESSDVFSEASTKADEISKSKSPEWYQEYFTLQSKLFRNLGQIGLGAHDELLSRLKGPLSEAQESSLKENISRVDQENDELLKRIKEIESRQGVTLVKE